MTEEMVEAKDPCVDCNKVFMRKKQRGRPPTRCNECREVHEIKKVEERQLKPDLTANRPAQLNVDEVLWTGGDVIPTRQDLPKGREAQCPICMRLFSSDTACERHKPYSEPKSTHCKPPASLGMIAIEKRGLPIWTKREG